MKSALIVAHPGHELRVLHWLERAQPDVSILTDGSGGKESSRVCYSNAVVEATGAHRGPVFGRMSDKDWYDAILRHELRFFAETVEMIVNSLLDEPEILVVSDAVDGYNPVHDLCQAVGAVVAGSLRRAGAKVDHLVSPAVPIQGAIAETILLDDAAVARKNRLIESYFPLAEEARRMRERVPVDVETLLEPAFDWPADFHPDWERVGRERVASGLYGETITYGGHVRPLALRILDMA